MTTQDRRISISITRCARCGGSHQGLEFIARRKAVEIDGFLFKYWALCPDTNQVINLRIDQTEEKA